MQEIDHISNLSLEQARCLLEQVVMLENSFSQNNQSSGLISLGVFMEKLARVVRIRIEEQK